MFCHSSGDGRGIRQRNSFSKRSSGICALWNLGISSEDKDQVLLKVFPPGESCCSSGKWSKEGSYISITSSYPNLLLRLQNECALTNDRYSFLTEMTDPETPTIQNTAQNQERCYFFVQMAGCSQLARSSQITGACYFITPYFANQQILK